MKLQQFIASITQLPTLAKLFSALSFGLMLSLSPASYAAKDKAPAPIAVAKISINQASAELLAEILNGVGIKKAEAIVAYRKANGKFKSIDDLALVKGIGEKTVQKNRANLTL